MANNIAVTDLPAQSDLFGIGSYIDSMAQFIEQCNTPLTISIQGTWGTGKTSVMKMIENKLDKSVCKYIEFNTWQFSQFEMDSSLSVNLIRSLIDDMDLKPEQKSSMGKSLLKLTKWAAPSIIEAVSGIGNLGGSAGEIITNLANALDGKAENPIADIKEIKRKFQECITDCKHNNKVDRIVIFIDDLDRLAPQKAVELLEVLKNFLDCPDCVFVLAIDYDVVCRGVAAKYGELDPDNAKNKKKGKDFFDKIIQVPFKMPVAQYDIKNFLGNCLKNIKVNGKSLNLSKNDIEQCYKLAGLSIGKNPRAIKRLTNSYQLLLMVAATQDKKNIKNPVILFATLCLQEMNQEIYNTIVKNRVVLSEDMLECLRKCEDEKVREFYPNLETTDDEKDAISAFMDAFIEAVDTDDTVGLGDDEIDVLRDILDLSSITSTDDDAANLKFTQNNHFVYKKKRYGSHGSNTLGMLARDIFINEVIKESWTSEDVIEFGKKANEIQKWKRLTTLWSFDKKNLEDRFAESPVKFADGKTGYFWRWCGAEDIEKLVSILAKMGIEVDCHRV